jgi:SAM-dependent methyltransferase
MTWKRTSPSDEAAQFDEYAPHYADLLRDPIRERLAASSRFFFERKLEVVRQFYRRQRLDTQTVTWLDVGCGQGDMLRLGHSYFKSASGCDVSERMLELCADLQVQRQPSPLEIPAADDSVDFATAICVYHHVPENLRPSFTAEILRVLKPGGILCIIEHNPLNPATRLIVSRTPVDADAHLLSAGTAARLMSRAGATVLQTRYFLWLPQQIHKYAGALEDYLGAVPFGGQYAVFAQAPPSRS